MTMIASSNINTMLANSNINNTNTNDMSFIIIIIIINSNEVWSKYAQRVLMTPLLRSP